MATLNEQRKKRARLGFRYTMELNFTSEDSKKSRVESAKQRLAPRGSPPLDSRELLSSLLDLAEATPPPATTCTGDQFRSRAVPTGSMTMHAGKLRCVLDSRNSLISHKQQTNYCA